MKHLHLSKTLFILSGIFLISACGNAKEVKSDNTAEASTSVTASESVETVNESASNQSEEIVMDENKVYFNYPSGFYHESISLELMYMNEDATIYYTVDGSTPDENSLLYKGSIDLVNATMKANAISSRTDIQVGCTFTPVGDVIKANIIRAIAVNTDGSVSEISSGTFFVGIDREACYSDVPVISIITDEANLYDYETGIYVLGKTYDEWLKEDPANASKADWQSVGNFSNKGKEWERPVSFEYLGFDISDNYSANLGLKIKGASTRGYYQKSLKLTAREEYGTKNIKHELIPGIPKYKSFVLRNGGNDNGFAKYRDPLLQTLATGMDFETQASTPCVVFINGEYFGIYEITEDYTDKLIEYKYDIEDNEVVIVKCGELDEGSDEDFVLYTDMFDFITTNDMTDVTLYDEAAKMLDLQSFADYFAFEIYIYNQDSIVNNNNWAMWRLKNDGIWKMMVYDTEYSTGVYNEGKTATTDNFSEVFDKEVEDDSPMLIFRSLYENDDFKAMFYNSLCDVRNYYFEKSRATATSNEMAATYKVLISDSIYRNGPDWVALWQDPNDYYKSKVGELNLFLNGRYTQFLEIVQKLQGFNAMTTLKLKQSDLEAGTLKVNNTALDMENLSKNTYTGLYYQEFPITITATPAEGKSFDHWNVEGLDTSSLDLTNAVLTFNLTADCNIEPVFK